MSKYSVEEVREWKGIAESNANLYTKMTGAHESWTKLAGMLADLLERIKADEGADGNDPITEYYEDRNRNRSQGGFTHPRNAETKPAQAAQVDVIGHPRGPNEQRDEIELYLRDAYAAGCHAAQSRSMVTAMEYAHREAPKLRAIVKPTAEPVAQGEVSVYGTREKEAVELASILDGLHEGGYDLENLYVTDPADGDCFVARAADLLREFAAQPRAVPDGWSITPEPNPLGGKNAMCLRDPSGRSALFGTFSEEVVVRDFLAALLAAAPSPGESA